MCLFFPPHTKSNIKVSQKFYNILVCANLQHVYHVTKAEGKWYACLTFKATSRISCLWYEQWLIICRFEKIKGIKNYIT